MLLLFGSQKHGKIKAPLSEIEMLDLAFVTSMPDGEGKNQQA